MQGHYGDVDPEPFDLNPVHGRGLLRVVELQPGPSVERVQPEVIGADLLDLLLTSHVKDVIHPPGAASFGTVQPVGYEARDLTKEVGLRPPVPPFARLVVAPECWSAAIDPESGVRKARALEVSKGIGYAVFKDFSNGDDGCEMAVVAHYSMIAKTVSNGND